MTPEERDQQVAQAKVGMRALIDEATGFQDVRDPDDLQRYAESLGVVVPDSWLSLLDDDG